MSSPCSAMMKLPLKTVSRKHPLPSHELLWSGVWGRQQKVWFAMLSTPTLLSLQFTKWLEGGIQILSHQTGSPHISQQSRGPSFFLDVQAAGEPLPSIPLSFHAAPSALPLSLFANKLQMAQRCFQNEYFDSLLHACKPCHLRCSNTPPVTCWRYCDTSTRSSVKGTSAALWTCLGLSVALSLVVFTILFLLRKASSEPLKDGFQNTGSALLDMANTDRDPSRTGDEMILPRSLGYTVEECTCDDCVTSKAKVDSDHFFPLPAMEEGATILVTTKTNDYCERVPAAPEGVPGTDGTEK